MIRKKRDGLQEVERMVSQCFWDIMIHMMRQNKQERTGKEIILFYKKGNDENHSDLKGRELIKIPKGEGTIGYRKDTNKWRTVLRKEGKTILYKQFSTKEEAEQYLNEYLNQL